jgi:hypothetical protein
LTTKILTGKIEGRVRAMAEADMAYQFALSRQWDRGVVRERLAARRRDRRRIAKRRQDFKVQESSAWILLRERFGYRLTAPVLRTIAAVVGRWTGEGPDREARRRKEILVKWLEDRFEVLVQVVPSLILIQNVDDGTITAVLCVQTREGPKIQWMESSQGIDRSHAGGKLKTRVGGAAPARPSCLAKCPFTSPRLVTDHLTHMDLPSASEPPAGPTDPDSAGKQGQYTTG